MEKADVVKKKQKEEEKNLEKGRCRRTKMQQEEKVGNRKEESAEEGVGKNKMKKKDEEADEAYGLQKIVEVGGIGIRYGKPYRSKKMVMMMIREKQTTEKQSQARNLDLF